MEPLSRRVFVVRAIACGSAALPIVASAAPRVSEEDEIAVALGYKHDTNAVDRARFPKHRPEQRCSNCSFFQGAPTDAWGGCAMFGRKQIAGPGWCNAWAKVPG